MFWPETWSKQNFKSLNHFTFLFLASFLQKWLLNTCFLNRLSPKFAGSSPFLFFEDHHFSPFKSSTGAAETHAVVCGRGLVPAAWSTARPLLGVWGGNLNIPGDIWDDFGGTSQFFFFIGVEMAGNQWQAIGLYPMAAYWPRHFQQCVLFVWFSEIDKEMHTLLYCTSHNLIADCRRRNRDYHRHIYWMKTGERSRKFHAFSDMNWTSHNLRWRNEAKKRKELGSAQDGLRQD